MIGRKQKNFKLNRSSFGDRSKKNNQIPNIVQEAIKNFFDNSGTS